MKKIILLLLTLLCIIFFSCTKNWVVPAYAPPVTTNFTVTSMNHTKDTVNVGDTIFMNVVEAIMIL